jgi:hypothetical protein
VCTFIDPVWTVPERRDREWILGGEEVRLLTSESIGPGGVRGRQDKKRRGLVSFGRLDKNDKALLGGNEAGPGGKGELKNDPIGRDRMEEEGISGSVNLSKERGR